MAWEFLVLDRTERLVRSESFRSLHRRIVAALEEVGEVGVLSGDDLARVLDDVISRDLTSHGVAAVVRRVTCDGRARIGDSGLVTQVGRHGRHARRAALSDGPSGGACASWTRTSW
jgi:hypothetical protein